MSKYKLLQVMLVTGTLVVAGCSSTPTDDAGTAADTDTDVTEEEVAEEEEEREAGGLMPLDSEPMEEEAEVPSLDRPEQDIVYFEFDSFSLDTDTRAILDEHVGYMRENSDAVVVLEGHTDERGSAEYNLALGENRAKAVMDYMNLRGIDNSQMYVTSFGESTPAVEESNEEAWAMNRRVEIKYQD